MIETIALTDYFDFSNPNIIRVKRHRIGIEHILDYYFAGYQPDEITNEFPGLELKVVYAAITYYLVNQQAIDAYLANRRQRSEQAYAEWAANPSPIIERLRAFREKQASYHP